MTNTEMPAVEASSYELAFHVLPTIAEGEVTKVFEKLKAVITKHGGTITTEEAPARFDLAYELVKYLEGRNRKFTSAYFGWVRFTIEPAEIEAVTEAVEHTKELLRHLLVRLTKVEEAHPFFFHEAIASLKQTEIIDLDEEAEASGDEEETEDEADEEADEVTEDGVESEDKV